MAMVAVATAWQVARANTQTLSLHLMLIDTVLVAFAAAVSQMHTATWLIPAVT